MADVPIGVLLSGGVDSSSIVALLHRTGYRPLKTFSVRFHEASFDESQHAAQVARLFGTEHRTRTFTPQDLIDRLPRLASMLDEPFADPSILPTSLLCELAAEHVKTVLSGDGADELFAGYDPFKALSAARWYERLVPRFLTSAVISPLLSLWPDSDNNMSFAFKATRFLRGMHLPSTQRAAVWMGPFSVGQLRTLLPDIELSHAAPTDRSEERLAGMDAVDLTLGFYQRSYLAGDILVKVDRASMMHSLEVRAPFLDTRLAEYVNGLPSRYKYHRGTTKRVLKEALINSGLLPERIVHRRKKGFGIPVARWVRIELLDLFRNALIDDFPKSLPMFDRQAICTLWDAHLRRRANHYKELWALFMLAQWAKQALEQPVPDLLPHPSLSQMSNKGCTSRAKKAA
jgi:asparagine synthase (glutamine-hydrolysing)